MNEKKVFKTESGAVIVFKEFLTGADQRAYRSVLIGLEEQLNKGESLNLIEDAVINTTVVSLNGSTDNILEGILALSSVEYTEVLEKAQEIIVGLSKKKEETSNGSTKTGSEEQK